jgi:hypothetical protein
LIDYLAKESAMAKIKIPTAVRLKAEQFQLVGYLRSKGFGLLHGKGLI